MRTPEPRPNELDWASFGKIPVASGGRVMPIDTVARNALLQLRQRETAMTKEGEKIPATQWMLDLMTRSPNAISNRVFKIDNPDIKKILELEDRRGHLYSTEDLLKNLKKFEDQVAVAHKRQQDKEPLTILQRRMLVLDGQMNQYMLLFRAFSFPDLPAFPRETDSPEVAKEKMLELRMAMMESSEALRRGNPPLLIPLPDSGDPKKPRWISLHDALIVWRIETQLQGTEGDPVTGAFVKIMSAYSDYAQAAAAVKKATADKESAAKIKTLEADLQKTIEPFNTAVQRYLSQVERVHPQQYSERKIQLETWMNRVSPFYIGMELYVIAFLLAVVGWLIPSRKVNWAAFTLVVLTFALHTAALKFRIDISGRPPVTNLYSSAVFIGWGCVLLGIIIEMIYRIGLGNLVATVAGFNTLIIAYFLSMSGDTIGVMQAVLDTQFWLATHVVCITLGYTATYVAGLLGVAFVVLGVATPRLDAVSRRNLGRMIYGITCFAMFFSFFGTVLGGLWADDSWGRFWGWDPKENGALIIVLWNALILHARWDKLVKDRGLALLAIGGNIVTSWSWFGVNELGIGLHSYGFTQGVLLALGAFVLSQIMLIIVGLLPLKHWWSVNSESSGISTLAG
jgi:ABC-type transport system involved in cytochrome c biogenesis permease subunit